MAPEPRRVALALAGFQAIDAVACAVPLRILKNDLDRLGVPDSLQRALPIVKGVSATGLAVGLKRPWLGQVTAAALIAYFLAALRFHIRTGDGPLRCAPAAAVMTWAAMALRSYRSDDRLEPAPV